MEQSKKGQHHPNAAADKQSTSELSAVPKPKHKHYGHRERMRTRFQKSGLEGFQPHEILELLLFYALPRVDTNPIAHDLIDTFHSLSGVMDADIQDLKHVKGISENAAVFLKLLPELFQQYQLDKLREHAALNTTEKLSAYIAAKLSDAVEEKALLLCLDAHLHLLHCETISAGTAQSTILDTHRIVECAIRMRSSRIVLAHNHPQGKACFSRCGPVRHPAAAACAGQYADPAVGSHRAGKIWRNHLHGGRSWGGVKYKEGFHGSF